ncbi:hypothetical protein OIO89_00305 (plasmid) [Mycobacterium ulcerans]|nr:hypothetical protein OIO89_00305 [Mycobacterium ulcerans]
MVSRPKRTPPLLLDTDDNTNSDTLTTALTLPTRENQLAARRDFVVIPA